MQRVLGRSLHWKPKAEKHASRIFSTEPIIHKMVKIDSLLTQFLHLKKCSVVYKG